MDHLWTSVLNIVPLSHLFGVFCMFVFVLLYNRYLNSFFFFEKPEKPQQIPWRSSWISLRQMVLSFAIPFTATTFSRGPPVTTRSLKVGESMKSISFEKRFWQICDVFLCLLTSVDWVLCIFSTIYPKRHQHRVLHLTPVLSIRNALLEDSWMGRQPYGFGATLCSWSDMSTTRLAWVEKSSSDSTIIKSV